MVPSINFQIKQRLENQYEWLSYYQSILDHMYISDDIRQIYYEKNLILLILSEFINLPSNLLRTLEKIKLKSNIKFIKTEIAYLETLLKK